MASQIGHFINGKNVPGGSGRFGDVFNPATGEKTAEVALASTAEVDAAVQVAKAAQVAWGAMPPLRRARVMFKVKDLIEKRIDDIARQLSLEHGKTFDDAKGEVGRGLEVVEFACGIAHHLRGDYTEQIATDMDSWSMRQPLGVVAGITPFNFPIMIPCWMGAMAVACGNAFILKPSEKDPSAPMLLTELFAEAGVPAGIFQAINGDKEAVDALLKHPDVPAISFVGSTAIGRYVYQTGTQHDKRVQALCGAKNHMVVMPDADLDQTTDALIGAGYGAAGERCMAISVAVAVGDIGDKLVEKLAPRVQKLKVGPGLDPQSEMGPLVTRQHLDKVKGYVDQGVKEGAKLVVDGRDLRLQGYENGNFMGGCLFDNVTTDMTIYKDEIFGPVLSIVRAKGFDEAIKMVNDHAYGNGTAIFTRDGDSARAFANNVKIGMVGVNVPIPVPVAYHSFGGWKASIFGDHGIYGMEGVRFFTKLKTVSARWPTGIRSGAEFNFRSRH
ncbi:CoA-acylating methylmalonate-semialdehyde dehydrogenase [Reyranella sp. CPCC 100927]|uniref:CoA-acylating methylmalonate-semialdehyde dehydrogenase n=1 Tax=Reyranella sp. CPCC 100927 TaxID=2599616 RepID=UPI0011B5AFC7|nr:CoA-acylating methylmalonate-semialdehyde dehydrogenase [Reyranella sp. CPCC 100927]TWS99882.1 CoA-acylating methylmalonate-semialdehyde dehydrogenase [Reyranella sp. CPCC 100927]